MTLYYKPWYYGLSHVISGFIAVWYPLIGVLAVLYQLGQLVFNIRIFVVEMDIKKGNSIEHTFLKISEIALGYIIGYFVKTS